MSSPHVYRPDSTSKECASEIVRRVFPRARARSESTKITTAIIAAEIDRYVTAKAPNPSDQRADAREESK